MEDKTIQTINPDLPTLNESQKRMLTGKTPAKYIKLRPGRGGNKYPYVEIAYITAELNKIFPAWSDKVIDKGITDTQVWVQLELTVWYNKEFSVTKTGFGGVEIKKYPLRKWDDRQKKYIQNTDPNAGMTIDLGDDLKGAKADALKKAAAEFGIAADVYSKEDYYAEGREPAATGEEAVDSLKLQSMRKFFAVAGERGFAEEEAKNLIKKKYKATHMDNLSVEQLNETIVSLVSKYKVVGRGNKPELFIVGSSVQEKTDISTPEQTSDVQEGEVVDETISIKYFCQGKKHTTQDNQVETTIENPWCSQECQDSIYPPKKKNFTFGKKNEANKTRATA